MLDVKQGSVMTCKREFLKVDLPKWIEGTVSKYERGQEWNSAWFETYKELGGKSDESGKKGCPRAAAKTLYELGRIIGHGTARNLPLSQVVRKHSKNGAYAIAAIELLNKEPALDLTTLWSRIQQRIRTESGEEPAASNQGGPTLTYKLWQMGLVQ